ncbi:MAG: DUF6659 family protein [Nitrosotalea sp.]
MTVQLDMLDSIGNDILTLDNKIRFVGIISDKGKLLSWNKKNGIRTLIDPKEQEVLLMEIALGVRMRREHDSYLGPVNFTVSYGEKTVLMVFPFGMEILCISAEKEIDVSQVPFRIFRYLEQDQFQKEHALTCETMDNLI